MELNKILHHVDHTLLTQSCNWEDIKEILDDAIKYDCASACIPPSFVKKAAEYVNGKLPICTVIGFPNGYSTTNVKVFETSDAIQNGASEIDMVININWLKENKKDELLNEINDIKKACQGKLLKVIVETCLLDDEEKIEICKIINESNADYIKTSTGFSTGGATFHDIEIFKENINADKKIKASGGIKSLDDAVKYLEMGCERLGISRIVKIIKEQNNISTLFERRY